MRFLAQRKPTRATVKRTPRRMFKVQHAPRLEYTPAMAHGATLYAHCGAMLRVHGSGIDTMTLSKHRPARYVDGADITPCATCVSKKDALARQADRKRTAAEKRTASRRAERQRSKLAGRATVGSENARRATRAFGDLYDDESAHG